LIAVSILTAHIRIQQRRHRSAVLCGSGPDIRPAETRFRSVSGTALRSALAEFLKDRVVNGRDVAGVLAQVEPYPGYRRTVQAPQNYTGFVRQDDGEQLPPVKKAIGPGDDYPGAPRLTRLLRLLGDLPPDADVPADETITPPLYRTPLRTFSDGMGGKWADSMNATWKCECGRHLVKRSGAICAAIGESREQTASVPRILRIVAG